MALTERVEVGSLTRVIEASLVAAAFLLVVGSAAANGAYFPISWNWTTLLVLAVLAVLLVVGDRRPDPLALVAPAGFLLFAGWQIIATSSAGRLDESQRTLVYVAVTLAAAILLKSRRTAALVGVLSGCVLVATYALSTRLLPDRLGTFDDVAIYRLAEPLGYWNALAILSAMGLLLALGFLGRAATPVARALAAATVPLLATTVYFTFGRGGWIALAFGLFTMLAFDPERLTGSFRVLIVAPFAAAAVLLASRQESLTTVNAELGEATKEGHRLLLWLVLLCVGAGVAAAAVDIARRRVAPGRRVVMAYVYGILGAAALLLIVLFARFGAPWTIAADAYDSFTSPPPRVQNLNDRLFTFSSNGRIELWEAAWENYKDHPLTGSGAGTFEQYWLENREVGLKVRDAHSLYLETLSELGPLGLALLLLALGVPVYAAFKARGHPLVPAAFGAYVAYLVHAGVDWDWEMPAVTLTALFIGASIVVAARKPEDEEKTMSPRLRYGLLAGTLALAAVAFVGLVGNIALAQSADEARAGDWDKSESKARRAETWAPWSPEPWQRIGEAQLAVGELASARASFRKAIAKDERDWNLWLDLSRASEGRAQLDALAQATKLNPLSPELAQLRKELAELGTIEVGG